MPPKPRAHKGTVIPPPPKKTRDEWSRWIDAADKYAADVRTGKEPACKWIKLACLRYERDKAREPAHKADATGYLDRRWPFYFDRKAGGRICKFIELLPHSKGKWAADGQNIVLENWQCWVLVNVFGFLRKKDNKRRFREALSIIPRKNGKSAMSAGVGLYMLTMDGEHGAEVYSGATTEKQAWEVFRPAKIMAQKRPNLCAQFGVEVNASNIHILSNGSRFEPLIGKPGDGSSPSCAIVDEFHEHETSDQYDTMLTGMGAREQPLMWVITTAGDNLGGPCYDKLLTGRKVLEGIQQDDEKFFAEWTVDDGDDWTDVAVLRKANPNFDVSVGGDFLESRQREAVANAREQGRFKTKHLNLWVQSRSASFNMQKWSAGYDPLLKIEDFKGRKAYLGLDLASEVDIAALEIAIEDDNGGFVRFGNHYLPEDTVDEPKNANYRAWRETGELTVTDGGMIDFARIKEDIVALAEILDVEVGFDPFQATYLVTQLMELGISCIKYPQQVATMSPAMKRLDALITDGKLRHACGERSLMTWMMSNVVSRVDAKDNIYPRKERAENKIDGPVALMMALGRAITVTPSEVSVYVTESRGIFSF